MMNEHPVRDWGYMTKFCDALKSAWALVPQMRFGQFLWNIFMLVQSDNDDLFYDDDDFIAEELIRLTEIMRGVMNDEGRVTTTKPSFKLPRYKGYHALVVEMGDGRGYWGRIEDISDLVDFVSDTREGVDTEFRKAVDGYIISIGGNKK